MEIKGELEDLPHPKKTPKVTPQIFPLRKLPPKNVSLGAVETM